MKTLKADKGCIVASHPSDFSQVMDILKSITCPYCESALSEVANNGLERLWNWWLAEETRSACGVKTRVSVTRKSDNTMMSVTFQCERPIKGDWQPVFHFISQHWPGKQPPHNQLQVPNSDIGKGLMNDKEKDHAIAVLAAQCHRKVEQFHFRGKGSISLDIRVSDAKMVVIQSAIKELTVGLSALWK